MLRFWVAEVDENIEGVIETIADALGTFQLSAPHLTSPALRVEDAST
ncbi:MAG: endonuclease domain-containing protein [Candidatus Dormibacteraeota bacterium]|nr:endonuclease domain-containing protein [Candidatus Dormibacteraeota bacterium]